MDIWDGVKKGLSSFAPLLANAVVPGSGGLVGSLVSSVLGCDNDAGSIELALVNATPEQKNALIAESNRHKERLLEIEASLESMRYADVSNARSRDVDLKKAGYRNYRADAMVFVAFASFCFLVYLINTNSGIKPEVLAIFNMSIGTILKMLSDAFNFEFGSSRGSKEKDIK